MPSIIVHHSTFSPRTLARGAALLMLLTIVLGVAAQAGISDRLVTFSDAERTARNILGNASLYGTGFTLYMVEMSAQVAGAVLFYHLLTPVHRQVASLALVFGLVGCTIKVMSRVFYLAALIVLERGTVGTLGGDQLPMVSMVLLTVNDHGAGVALGFFGIETLLEGWLIIRSTFLPRWLGVLTMIAGVGWLAFLTPSLGREAFTGIALVALVGSIATIGWLLVKGVDDERWHSLAVPRERGRAS